MSATGNVSVGPGPQSGQRTPLTDLLPGLDRRLTEESRSVIARVQLPVLAAFEGPFDLEAALSRSQAFALVIADGMMLRMLSLGGHAGLQVLGPGDLISRPGESGTDLLSESGLQARGLVRYAPLDDRLLVLTRRFPRLIEGLQMCRDDQQQRLLAQLLICQLPRVEDRVLALMWLLSETWGRVTATGTLLPVRLTHDAIGLMVGARRPTVTLALRALEDRGALVRRADDWLILEHSEPAPTLRPVSLPSLVAQPASSPWGRSAAGRSGGGSAGPDGPAARAPGGDDGGGPGAHRHRRRRLPAQQSRARADRDAALSRRRVPSSG